MPQSSFDCPVCRIALFSRSHKRGSSYRCGTCGGAAITIPVVRQNASATLSQSIWSALRKSSTRSERPCPSCKRALRSFHVESAGLTELDGCLPCLLLWFDPTELSRLGIALPDRMSVDARQAVALMEVESAVARERTLESARMVARILFALGYALKRWM